MMISYIACILFGFVIGMLVCETILERVEREVRKQTEDIRNVLKNSVCRMEIIDETKKDRD